MNIRRILLLPIVLLATNLTRAAEFRIETRVFAAEEKTPASESVTLFRNDVTYDIRDSAGQVTIFRPGIGNKPGRFILLDRNRELKTEIETPQIAKLMEKLRRWTATQEDPFLKFTGAPTFEERFDAATGTLDLTSDQLTYKLVTVPVANPQAMKQLKEFLDWFAQLHTLLEAGLPPDPRLKVNEALARRNLAPVQIELTSRDDEKPSLRAEHLVTWILSKQDQLRIDEVNEQLAVFKEVTNAEFQKGREVAKR